MNYSLLELFICAVKKFPYQSTFHQLKTHIMADLTFELWTRLFSEVTATHRYSDAGGS